jgi:hypothetical protein
VVCDEHGIGGGGEYCGGKDAQLDSINVFYLQASGGMYVPHALIFDLEPGLIDAVTLSRRSASSSACPTSWKKTSAPAATGLRPTTQRLARTPLNPPVG